MNQFVIKCLWNYLINIWELVFSTNICRCFSQVCNGVRSGAARSGPAQRSGETEDYGAGACERSGTARREQAQRLQGVGGRNATERSEGGSRVGAGPRGWWVGCQGFASRKVADAGPFCLAGPPQCLCNRSDNILATDTGSSPLEDEVLKWNRPYLDM